MIAIVAGLGSIGSRHVEVLRGLGVDVATVSRRAGGHHSTIAAALAARPEASYVVVATETDRHRAALDELATAGFTGRVMVEKPLAGVLADAAEATTLGLDVVVGYNLRFHPVVAELRTWLSAHHVASVQIRAGQNLRQWRPGRTPAATASAAAGSGGVLRDLSHELDYLLWLFGDWSRVVAIVGHRSARLGIESEDVVVCLVELTSGVLVSVELNYFDGTARRTVTVTGDTGTATADLVGQTFDDGSGRRISAAIARSDTYRWMHRECLGPDRPAVTCSLDQGIAVMALIDAIERSARSGGWVINDRSGAGIDRSVATVTEPVEMEPIG